MKSFLENRIDKYYKIKDLYKNFYGYTPGSMVVCPFHSDTRASAKIFNDPNGDRLYCFSCNRQYTPSDILKKFSQNLRDWDVPYFGDKIKEEGKRDFNFEALDPFKKGAIDMREFCRQVYYLGKREAK